MIDEIHGLKRDIIEVCVLLVIVVILITTSLAYFTIINKVLTCTHYSRTTGTCLEYTKE